MGPFLHDHPVAVYWAVSGTGPQRLIVRAVESATHAVVTLDDTSTTTVDLTQTPWSPETTVGAGLVSRTRRITCVTALDGDEHLVGEVIPRTLPFAT